MLGDAHGGRPLDDQLVVEVGGLAREDARDAGRIARLVEAPAAALGDHLQHRLIGAVADADGGDGDAGGGRGVDQVGDLVVGGLSVGEEDDVLLARARRQQLVDRLAQPGQDVGAAAGLDAADVVGDPLPVRRALQLDDRLRLAVEHDDRDLIGRRQRLGGGARGLLGEVQLLAGHRSRLVDHQRQRQRGLFLALGDVEAQRQQRRQARPAA